MNPFNVFGGGRVSFLVVGVLIGVGLFPVGRAFLRAIWNKIVADVGKIVHAKIDGAKFPKLPVPIAIPAAQVAKAVGEAAVAAAVEAKPAV